MYKVSCAIDRVNDRSDCATNKLGILGKSLCPGDLSFLLCRWEGWIRWFPDFFPALIFDSAVKKLDHNLIVSFYLGLLAPTYSAFDFLSHFCIYFHIQSSQYFWRESPHLQKS